MNVSLLISKTPLGGGGRLGARRVKRESGRQKITPGVKLKSPRSSTWKTEGLPGDERSAFSRRRSAFVLAESRSQNARRFK
jgi:hypothetical protein